MRNIVFYDDVLFCQATKGIKPLLRQIINEKNFIPPHGLHAKFIDQELTELLFNAKFVNPRFSLEAPILMNNDEFARTIKYLNRAGYKKGEYTP